MLSGFSGGAALNMGEGFLLASIAVVVIGGTSVAGGRANVPGVWGAALFIYLLDTMLNIFGASAGIRLIMTGAHHHSRHHHCRRRPRAAHMIWSPPSPSL